MSNLVKVPKKHRASLAVGGAGVVSLLFIHWLVGVLLLAAAYTMYKGKLQWRG